MTAVDALQQLYERDGFLTAEQIVTEATNKKSPLHDHFEWNNTEAAERYRLLQAGQLIRRCKINIEIAPEEVRRVRSFVNLPKGDAREYSGILEALNGPQRDIVTQQAQRDLSAFRRKYETLIDVDALIRSTLSEEAVA